MSRYLSLSAFAAELGWPQDDVMNLITENRIKAYQLAGCEPYIPKTEVAKVTAMSYRANAASAKEEQLSQDEVDRVSRAHSRSKIAAERAALDTKAEQRRSASALKRANRPYESS